MSKDQVFSITCITQWENSTVHCVSELCYILTISVFSSSFYKPNNITTKLSLKVKSYFQS